MGGADSRDRSGEPRAYIGSFTSAGGRGVTTAAVDPKTGALTPLAVTAAEDPSYLALSRATGVLYAVNETERGAVTAFRPTAAGLAPSAGPSASGAPGPPTSAWPGAGCSPPTTPPAASVASRSTPTVARAAPRTSCRTGVPDPTPAGRRARTPIRCCPTRPAAGCSAWTSAPTRYGSARWTRPPGRCGCTQRPRCAPGPAPATSPSIRRARWRTYCTSWSRR